MEVYSYSNSYNSYSDVKFSCKGQGAVTQATFTFAVDVLTMAEREQVDEQDSSVVSTASNSLEAVASTSSTSDNHPNVS